MLSSGSAKLPRHAVSRWGIVRASAAVAFVFLAQAVTLCADRRLEEVRALIERTESKARLERLRADPDFYDRYVAWVASAGTTYHRRMLARAVGYRSIEQWGGILTRPSPYECLDELLHWVDDEDDSLRSFVFELLLLLVEQESTPLQLVDQRILPVLQSIKDKPDSERAINESCSRTLEVLKWRRSLALRDGSATALVASSSELDARQMMRLLSLTPNSEAIELLRQRAREYGEQARVFLDVARLRQRLSARENGQAEVDVLVSYIKDDSISTAARIYALWTVRAQLRAEDVDQVYAALKQVLESRRSVPLRGDVDEFVRCLLDVPELSAEVERAAAHHGRLDRPHSE